METATSEAEFNEQWEDAGQPRLLVWARHHAGMFKTLIYMLYFSIFVAVREWYFRTYAIRLNKNTWLPANLPTATNLANCLRVFREFAPPGSVLTVRPPVDRLAQHVSIHACLCRDRSIEAWTVISLIQDTTDVETDFIAATIAVAMKLAERKRTNKRWAQGLVHTAPQ